MEQDRSLDARLRGAGDADGWMGFDRFMELAMYAPGVGYYSSGHRTLGAAGDFYTAAHASPLFARAVAERVWQEFERQGSPERFRLVELGPGDGTLAGDLVAHLRDRPGFGRWELVLADPAAGLRQAAERRVREAGGAAGVRTVAGISELGPFRGAVLANEVLDALPVRRFVARGGQWKELGVRPTESGWAWEERTAERIPAVLDAPAGPEGIIAEVAEGVEGVVRAVADRLVEGVAVFIDYGMERTELRRAHPHGTLEAYRAHRAVPEPLAEPGEQDLSCFVDFTALRAAVQRAGLVPVADRSQAEALFAWGLPALLRKAEDAEESGAGRVKVGLAAKNLLLGFERFRALELRPAGQRGAAAPS